MDEVLCHEVRLRHMKGVVLAESTALGIVAEALLRSWVGYSTIEHQAFDVEDLLKRTDPLLSLICSCNFQRWNHAEIRVEDS